MKRLIILLIKSFSITLFIVSLNGCHRRPTVLLTGYWPPTNEMLRPFSHDLHQNPKGWKGQNWQDTGYDVYAFFPEFPEGTSLNPRGIGDFEVDYQDTKADFEHVVGQINPVIIISYGRGKGPWEIETNFPYQAKWHPDFKAPFQPETIGDSKVKTYHSTLPTEAIRLAVRENVADLDVWIDEKGDPGDFLCGYLAYLVAEYKESNDHCKAAGFIHVGPDVDLSTAKKANEATLRAVIGDDKSMN